jgi:hypothetical protein
VTEHDVQADQAVLGVVEGGGGGAESCSVACLMITILTVSFAMRPARNYRTGWLAVPP